MKINSATVQAAENYVTDMLSKKLDKNFQFHNLSHTTDVVKAAGYLCTASGMDEYNQKIVLIAAWFHDTGYTQQIEGHESSGASLAENFLKEYEISEEDVQTVKSCILATRYP